MLIHFYDLHAVFTGCRCICIVIVHNCAPRVDTFPYMLFVGSAITSIYNFSF